MNRALPSLLGGRLKITLLVSLKTSNKGVYRNKCRGGQDLREAPKIRTVNSKHLASWISGISIRYLKGTHTVQIITF